MRRHFIVAALVGWSSMAALAASGGTTRPITDQGRALLQSGQVQEAESAARSALSGAADDAALSLLGEIEFRRAHFDLAAAAFESALRINADNARAAWGLGRLEELHFHRDQARDWFARAYRLDPRDTDIILSYAEYVIDPESRSVLLHNVAVLDRDTRPERARRAVAQIAIDRRLGGKTPARLASPYAAYRVPLAGYRPAGADQDGLVIAVRINGGRTLRLVLDSGARGILIEGAAAKGLDLDPIVESRLGGFGTGDAGEAHLALARELAVGALKFEDCLVEVSRHPITPGADGILGASLFERFRVRIDPHAGTLDLTPLDAAPAAGMQAIGLRHLLLIKTAVAGKEGWFLVDSGASHSTIGSGLAPPVLKQGAATGLVGVQGAIAGVSRLGAVTLEVGGRPLVEMAPVSLDLGPLSQREGIEISGVLGYPALSKGPFTLDFHSGTIALEGR